MQRLRSQLDGTGTSALSPDPGQYLQLMQQTPHHAELTSHLSYHLPQGAGGAHLLAAGADVQSKVPVAEDLTVKLYTFKFCWFCFFRLWTHHCSSSSSRAYLKCISYRSAIRKESSSRTPSPPQDVKTELQTARSHPKAHC